MSSPPSAVGEEALLSQGAEARLYVSELCGRPCIIKERFRKMYRHRDLDRKITQQRITQEARALARCRDLGVKCPALYAVDKGRGRLYMEYVHNAVTTKEFINQEPNNIERRIEAAKAMGRIVGLLHRSGMVHGDLTTSNLLRRHTGEFVVIDFGLASMSKLEEDMAVDLYVLERALISTHIGADEMFEVLLGEYCEAGGDFTHRVLKKLDEVRARGRKKTMLG